MRAGEERALLGAAERMTEWLDRGNTLPQGGMPLPPEGRKGDAGDRRFGTPVTYWQISTADGETVERSPHLDEFSLPLNEEALAAAMAGQSWSGTVRLGADRFLVLTAPTVGAGGVARVLTVARSLTVPDDYLATMRRNLLVGSGIAVAVAFGCGWVLSGLVLRPVEQITSTARAIGVERDFSRRVHYEGPRDEIGELATTFNSMLSELEAAYRQQKQFVADVSHELRTPLTTLRGNLELLRRDPPVSEEDRQEVLADMTSEGERLIRLVNDLLRLARADARQSLQSEIVPIAPLLEDLCRQARLLDPGRAISCTCHSDADLLADRDGLKQTLLILMDNALKHTTGPVVVTAAEGDDGLTVRVRDSGPGIPPDELPHVFDRFCRGHDRPSLESGGLGLGLSIAKSLVEAQGGTLSVQSDPERGSDFCVTFPVPVEA
jgi:signal transduction histidine kinase